MSRPASRVLAMLELLQTHHRLTGADLAARLGVDDRTVRRYAGNLAELGIPVTAARGRYGGYRLEPGFKLPPLMLTDEEAVAVVLGLLAADQLGLHTEAPATAAAHDKITRVLPRPLAERLGALESTLGFTAARRDGAARPATGTLLTLGAATRAHHRVTITYRSAKPTGGDRRWPGDRPSPVKLREVDPYGLVFHAGRWYLVGHDHLRDEIRTFRLDRITAVSSSTEAFEAPPNFDAVGHVTKTLAGLPWEHAVEVLLETDLTQARRRIPATVAELTETADGVLLRANANSLPGMATMLAGLGWPFTVLKPDALRGAVRELADALTGYASRPA
ncbi:helix-turn-helix transcriptional regulator [Spirilliplanes yamanashiensis]|uniref:Transcriptional regulator n=1 Tax=Spirilliplanes yamanashiensis TaxID=42233 RepID=A0A8J3YAJ3_9ACTN|nr:YafY family protein [Spirilliplanes yamanashiensis]MDP9818620.1 putative DNA-binding transcriptional regulator YafY [Spirilliplanes yamanashiensis]GIJ05076.1 transcriptional regulator [Spirilliplanes yamanashiensis]